VSADDWNRDEQQVRTRRCEYHVQTATNPPAYDGCGRRATWSTDDLGDITWLCDACCQRALSNVDDLDVTEIDP
jgi:hypothetical protein